MGFSNILLLHTSLSDGLSSRSRERGLSLISQELRDRTSRYIQEERGMVHLAGKLLLLDGLKRLGIRKSLDGLVYSPGGKPMLPGGPFFSISHSGFLVTCALSRDGELGLDVELYRERNPEDFRSWFSREEMDAASSSADPSRELLRIWTWKEALYKAAGEDVGGIWELPAVQEEGLLYKGKRWHSCPIRFDESHVATLVSEGMNPNISLVETDLESL